MFDLALFILEQIVLKVDSIAEDENVVEDLSLMLKLPFTCELNEEDEYVIFK